MAISYRQRGKKRLWDYRIIDSNKKVIASGAGYRTKREAEIDALSIELKLMNGVKIDKNITLYDLWEKWYTLQILPQNKSDATLLKHYYRGKRIKDYFGDEPASEIKPSEYQAFINHCATEVSRDSVSRLNSEIKTVIKFAQRDKLKVDDFTLGTIITGKKVGRPKNEKSIQSIADYRKLATYLENHLDLSTSVIPYLLYVQLKTGLRFGEVTGLSWDCVRWADLEIKTYRRYDSKRYCWTKPKTETSVRSVPIDEDTITVLKKLKSEQALWLKDKHNNENMLFIDPQTGVPTSAGVNKHLQNILKELDIFPNTLTSTGLRHTYPSILLAQGIDIWAIAKNMGHKDISQITETYGHLIKEKEDLENDKIRQFLSGSNKVTKW